MKMNIDIEDKLILAAMKISGVKTKKEAVGEGLKLIIQLNQQKGIRELSGKL
ncbi:type II toxin-antitoxin system VapB family antitoxin [Aquiflexum lacus]|uniref:type II toxin-antitoxin system VapB family antitoxin n=1 Tax=Aquiflexum lacus TaxID=2483805 RepID=UPI0018963751|nr:type II toxin-antitoxin system VapB family antitoxin [Aquiflexum lacus]